MSYGLCLCSVLLWSNVFVFVVKTLVCFVCDLLRDVVCLARVCDLCLWFVSCVCVCCRCDVLCVFCLVCLLV